jgi:hypothetical protein
MPYREIGGLRYYKLNSRKQVVPADMVDFEDWMKAVMENNSLRVVAKTDLPNNVEVSTVFLGVDHNFSGKGPPLLFETMIFGGEHDQDQWRYSTWAEAEKGHLRVINELLTGRPKPRCKLGTRNVVLDEDDD